MLYNLDSDKQREQFAKAIKHLKQGGLKQKDIAKQIGVFSYDISHWVSGAVKNIPDDVIDNLHEEFGINPNFIYKGSANMYDVSGIKYGNFENFVDDWDLVDHEGKSYLHFTMDSHFYNFLLDVYAQMESTIQIEKSQKMTDAITKAIENLKEHFDSTPEYQEYVLIPADDVIEIANDNIPKRKNLAEVIKILDLYAPTE